MNIFLVKSLFFAFIITFIIKLLSPEYSFLGLSALFIFFQQLGFLLLELGTCLPYRALFGVMMCLQMLVGPSLVYNGFEDDSIYGMKVPQAEYFYFVMPAVILFLIGLYINGKNRGEQIDRAKIVALVNRHKWFPFILIGVGLGSSVAGAFIPGLSFILYVFQMLKFVGMFLVFFGDYKFKIAWLSGVFATSIASSFGSGLFHDMLTWLILAGTIICMEYKFSFLTKIGWFVVFGAFVIFLQTIKTSYRQILYEGDQGASFAAVEEASRQAQENNDGSSIFSKKSITPQIVRINQGWIIASIMDNVPANEPFANGKSLVLYLEAATLPRFLAPNKLEAGDREIFMKYSGVIIAEGTSMGLSSVGDAYANFGISGGWFFMLFYGLMFNSFIKSIGFFSRNYPALVLFAAMIFIYPIRPDCELQTILGHLIKVSLLVFLVHRLLPKYLKSEKEA